MLIIIYFNTKLGSEIILTAPENLLEELGEESVDQIKSLMYTGDEGFFIHNFSSNLKTANVIFRINSKWARGRSELILLSSIIPEEEPNYAFYENLLMDFVTSICKYPEIYKAFYLDTVLAGERENVEYNLSLLKKELENLQKRLVLKNIETQGSLLPLKKLFEKKTIELKDSFISNIREFKSFHKNCFIVNRVSGDSIKIEILPCDEEKLTKILIIFGEQMNLNVLHQISKVFTNREKKIKLIYTTGVCREVDKCLYEVYVHLKEGQLEQLREEIIKIPGIISIEIKEIKLNE